MSRKQPTVDLGGRFGLIVLLDDQEAAAAFAGELPHLIDPSDGLARGK